MRLIALLLLALNAYAAGAQRIVSTSPTITETLFAMGLGPHVVGVTIYCKFPAEVEKLPKIGTYLKPDVEAIIALKPDLVVVHKQSNHLAEELARLHVPFVEVESQNLEAIYVGTREIGRPRARLNRPNGLFTALALSCRRSRVSRRASRSLLLHLSWDIRRGVWRAWLRDPALRIFRICSTMQAAEIFLPMLRSPIQRFPWRTFFRATRK